MIDWSVCRTRCQKSLPMKAAPRSLPEWQQPLLQPGFPRPTVTAWCAQAPVPAEGTFPWCQLNWKHGLGCLLWLLFFSLSCGLHFYHARLRPMIGEGDGTPLQYSCLENPKDRGAWWAAVHGVAKSQARLSDFTFTFHFHALEKEMATHSSVLAWRIPETEEPSGLLSMGSHRIGRDWSDLAAAAAAELIMTWKHESNLQNQDAVFSGPLDPWMPCALRTNHQIEF